MSFRAALRRRNRNIDSKPRNHAAEMRVESDHNGTNSPRNDHGDGLKEDSPKKHVWNYESAPKVHYKSIRGITVNGTAFDHHTIERLPKYSFEGGTSVDEIRWNEVYSKMKYIGPKNSSPKNSVDVWRVDGKERAVGKKNMMNSQPTSESTEPRNQPYSMYLHERMKGADVAYYLFDRNDLSTTISNLQTKSTQQATLIDSLQKKVNQQHAQFAKFCNSMNEEIRSHVKTIRTLRWRNEFLTRDRESIERKDFLDARKTMLLKTTPDQQLLRKVETLRRQAYEITSPNISGPFFDDVGLIEFTERMHFITPPLRNLVSNGTNDLNRPLKMVKVWGSREIGAESTVCMIDLKNWKLVNLMNSFKELKAPQISKEKKKKSFHLEEESSSSEEEEIDNTRRINELHAETVRFLELVMKKINEFFDLPPEQETKSNVSKATSENQSEESYNEQFSFEEEVVDEGEGNQFNVDFGKKKSKDRYVRYRNVVGEKYETSPILSTLLGYPSSTRFIDIVEFEGCGLFHHKSLLFKVLVDVFNVSSGLNLLHDDVKVHCKVVRGTNMSKMNIGKAYKKKRMLKYPSRISFEEERVPNSLNPFKSYGEHNKNYFLGEKQSGNGNGNDGSEGSDYVHYKQGLSNSTVFCLLKVSVAGDSRLYILDFERNQTIVPMEKIMGGFLDWYGTILGRQSSLFQNPVKKKGLEQEELKKQELFVFEPIVPSQKLELEVNKVNEVNEVNENKTSKSERFCKKLNNAVCMVRKIESLILCKIDPISYPLSMIVQKEEVKSEKEASFSNGGISLLDEFMKEEDVKLDSIDMNKDETKGEEKGVGKLIKEDEKLKFANGIASFDVCLNVKKRRKNKNKMSERKKRGEFKKRVFERTCVLRKFREESISDGVMAMVLGNMFVRRDVMYQPFQDFMIVKSMAKSGEDVKEEEERGNKAHNLVGYRLQQLDEVVMDLCSSNNGKKNKKVLCFKDYLVVMDRILEDVGGVGVSTVSIKLLCLELVVGVILKVLRNLEYLRDCVGVTTIDTEKGFDMLFIEVTQNLSFLDTKIRNVWISEDVVFDSLVAKKGEELVLFVGRFLEKMSVVVSRFLKVLGLVKNPFVKELAQSGKMCQLDSEFDVVGYVVFVVRKFLDSLKL